MDQIKKNEKEKTKLLFFDKLMFYSAISAATAFIVSRITRCCTSKNNNFNDSENQYNYFEPTKYESLKDYIVSEENSKEIEKNVQEEVKETKLPENVVKKTTNEVCEKKKGLQKSIDKNKDKEFEKLDFNFINTDLKLNGITFKFPKEEIYTFMNQISDKAGKEERRRLIEERGICFEKTLKRFRKETNKCAKKIKKRYGLNNEDFWKIVHKPTTKDHILRVKSRKAEYIKSNKENNAFLKKLNLNINDLEKELEMLKMENEKTEFPSRNEQSEIIDPYEQKIVYYENSQTDENNNVSIEQNDTNVQNYEYTDMFDNLLNENLNLKSEKKRISKKTKIWLENVERDISRMKISNFNFELIDEKIEIEKFYDSIQQYVRYALSIIGYRVDH